MPPRLHSFLVLVGAVGVVGIVAFAFFSLTPLSSTITKSGETQSASVSLVQAPENTAPEETPEPKKGTVPTIPPPAPLETNDEVSGIVQRVANPYSFPPFPFDAIKERAQTALVNILCTSDNSSIHPVSGSGIIVDPKGIILTNAHVAQYVLLAKEPGLRLSCVIRSGAPARPMWLAEVLYIPPVWVETHAADISKENPTGTGEHDYALLRITGLLDSRTPPAVSYPSLAPDTREAIAFPDDQMLAVAYPAEFVGNVVTEFNLHPFASVSRINELLTFETETADLMSFRGSVEAQGGASGGPIVNAWGYVVGIITTTSEEALIAQREMRALTMHYIDRDLLQQSGQRLAAMLSRDPRTLATEFSQTHAPRLINLLLLHIAR